MSNEDHIKELLKQEIHWLDRTTQIKIEAIEKATEVAMHTLDERLKGWPGKMDSIEKQVAEFRGRALVLGGIAGLVMSILGSVVIFRFLT